jgi:hypothetical protein
MTSALNDPVMSICTGAADAIPAGTTRHVTANPETKNPRTLMSHLSLKSDPQDLSPD